MNKLVIEYVDINSIRLNPENTNKHSDDQIRSLAKSIDYQKMRSPLVIARTVGDNEVNYLMKGEACYLACRSLGHTEVPVIFQHFIDEDQARAYVTSDNEFSKWSKTDYGQVNEQIASFDPSFDIDFLGIKNFKLDPDFEDEAKEKKPKLVKCPNCYNEFNL